MLEQRNRSNWRLEIRPELINWKKRCLSIFARLLFLFMTVSFSFRFNSSGKIWKILKTDRLCSSTSSFNVAKRSVYSCTLFFYYLTDTQIRNEKPNAERTQRLFASLRDELEKRAPSLNSNANNSNSSIGGVTVNGKKGPADGHVGS